MTAKAISQEMTFGRDDCNITCNFSFLHFTPDLSTRHNLTTTFESIKVEEKLCICENVCW
jgi:hypothetical protein